MSATLIEFPTAPLHIQPESNHQKILRDLSVATTTLELVGECEELAADLRSLVKAARLRLLGTAERLRGSEAAMPSATTPLSAAH
jgi:hypothetical protein